MKNWYTITNRANDVLDVSIHDEIGMFGISAGDFMAELRGSPDAKSINLSIHSPGGSALDGLAIYNSLKGHPAKVFGHVEGIAASAASFILMASDVITMPEDGYIMIHNANGGAMGDGDDLREMADVIDKITNTILNIYERRVDIDREVIAEMMKVETWLTADESLELGFIDTIADSIGVAAKANLFNEHFKNAPFNNESTVEGIETLRDFEKFLRDAGISKGLATALTSRAKVVFRGEPDDTDGALSAINDRLDNLELPQTS